MVQIDGPSRHIYIKFVNKEKMTDHLPRITGDHEYRHTNGELSTAMVSQTGLRFRIIRISGLPPEVKDNTISTTLTKYGDVMTINGDS
jgi:hypothetical protein